MAIIGGSALGADVTQLAGMPVLDNDKVWQGHG